MREIDAQLASLAEQAIDPKDVVRKLAEFEGVWGVMQFAERMALIHATVKRSGFRVIHE